VPQLLKSKEAMPCTYRNRARSLIILTGRLTPDDGLQEVNEHCFTAKSGTPTWKHIPSWYMVATNDQMIPAQADLIALAADSIAGS
jgi:hypothetical protein